MTAWALSLLSVVAVSLVSLAGLATLFLSERLARRLAVLLVSLAVGALLGDGSGRRPGGGQRKTFSFRPETQNTT